MKKKQRKILEKTEKRKLENGEKQKKFGRSNKITYKRTKEGSN